MTDHFLDPIVIEHAKKQLEGARYRGELILDLDRDHLLVAVWDAIERMREQREDSDRMYDLLTGRKP